MVLTKIKSYVFYEVQIVGKQTSNTLLSQSFRHLRRFADVQNIPSVASSRQCTCRINWQTHRMSFPTNKLKDKQIKHVLSSDAESMH